MKKMSKGQKQVLYVVAAGVAAYLLYRWYTNRNAASAGSTQMVPGSATDPQYAALAGQEQGDMASLQRQLLALTHREQNLAKLNRQEEAFIKAMEHQIKALQRGKDNDRTKSVEVKKGSKLWNYYRKVTGHDPPAHLQVSNLIYELFKAGVNWRRARDLFRKPEHPDHDPGHHGHHPPSGGVSPHPSRGPHDPRHHREVHHPNHGHHQRGGEHGRHRPQHHAPSGGATPRAPHNKGTRRSGVRR